MISKKTASRFLTAALLGASLAMTPTLASAQCSGGACGNPVDKAVDAIKAIEPTVASGTLQSAYEAIQAAHENATELNVENQTRVSSRIRNLVNQLEQRASSDFKLALSNYENGRYDSAVREYQRLAQLTGLPTANRAAKELKAEPDRKVYREVKEVAIGQVKSADHVAARETLSDLHSLSRSTGFSKDFREVTDELSETLMERVELAEMDIERERFETAYATLIEISRISEARKSAVAARRVIAKHALLEGMRLAKAEYNAQEQLTKVQTWIGEIAHPSPKERELYEAELTKIANAYGGTRAGDEAKELLIKTKDQQASF